MDDSPDPSDFIRRNLRLAPVPNLPSIRLYQPHPGSGLRRLLELSGEDHAAPYWAYPWAGGLLLARHLLACPELVRGRSVLDFGSGSGLVAIAAARAGAATVTAVEIDRNGRAALALNAAANDAEIAISGAELTVDQPLPDVELVLAGDVFYAPEVAASVIRLFDRFLAAGTPVLVGDIGRTDLPLARLRRIAEYPVVDFGEGPSATPRTGSVFEFVALSGS